MPPTVSGQLPLRDDKRAPRFKGRKVEEFIAVLEYLAESNAVAKDTLPKAVSCYVSSSVRSVLSAEPAFEGTDWDAAKAPANSPVPPARDPPPHQPNVMRVGLCRDGTPVFSYPTPASPADIEAYSFPVTTRSGAKPAEKQAASVPDASTNVPAPPRNAQILPTVAPQSNGPNTETGWNEARRDKSRAPPLLGAQDRAKPSCSSNLRFSSAIQDSISIADVEDHVLNTKVTLTLRECIGMSANLQKRFGGLVKTRREFDKQDDTPSSGVNRKSYPVTVEDCPETGLGLADMAPSLVAELSFEQGREILEDVLERYAASISLGNVRQFAMVSGTVECIWGGQKVVLLIDTGSELNLIGKTVFEASGLAIDEDGARWSLRGIGGSPIPLLGCVRDAPVQLSGKNFDHHFFVSSVARGIHDGILGQPWLSFFAAQFDYARDGTALLRAYSSGNRDGASVTLEICKANHPRNADRLVLTASLEEVQDESDF
ncbi:hypothetical protein OH76DRAFT_1490494 [Lentinus brumalis]|uniref:DUF4100 domain-containing protein n=1 Tax=Lentinus brumalis TaxID=2498619 RepID=A0A371CIU1_9APHY|nr:hypothetical protein OH76DRAFT_1490494 [Polyporus brumalis]